MLRVILDANRVCNGNATPKIKSLRGFWGVAFGDGRQLRPDPVHLISNPLEYFENRCTDCAVFERKRIRLDFPIG